jgi:hypothetical protein
LPSLFCPMPGGLAHDEARRIFSEVRKEMPDLSPAAQRREAARRANTDYDTFLKAWKKPTATPVLPSPVTVLDPVTPPLFKVTKVKSEATDLSYYSSRIKNASKVAQDIYIDGAKAGKVQKMVEGYYEMDNRIRTGRFIIERRGYAALDADGNIIKDGFKTIYRTSEEAVDAIRAKVIERAPKPTVPAPTVPKPVDVPKPAPTPLTPETARQQHALVKREHPDWTDAQCRREAANRMAVPYDDFLREWKAGKGVRVPKTSTPKAVTTPTNVINAPRTENLWRRKEPNVSGAPAGDIKVTNLHTDDYIRVNKAYEVGGKRVGGIIKNRLNDRYFGTVKRGARSLSKSFSTEAEADAWVRKTIFEENPDHIATNPGWRTVPGTTNNCTSCSTTFELRRRGYDVVARRMKDGQPLIDVYDSWGITLDQQFGRVQYHGIKSISEPDWEDVADTLEDGARGFISVNWRSGGAHIFNWEKRDGEIWYIDGQTGEEYLGSDHFESRVDGDWRIARVDNIPETDRIDWLTESRHDTGHQTTTKNPYQYEARKTPRRYSII